MTWNIMHNYINNYILKYVYGFRETIFLSFGYDTQYCRTVSYTHDPRRLQFVWTAIL